MGIRLAPQATVQPTSLITRWGAFRPMAVSSRSSRAMEARSRPLLNTCRTSFLRVPSQLSGPILGDVGPLA